MSNAPDPQFQIPHFLSEGAWLYGAFLTCILYGITIVLYFMCVHSLWHRIRSDNGQRKRKLFFFFYVNFIFALSTIYTVCNSQITNISFISYRDYPGGPDNYEAHISTLPMNLAFIVSDWCADSLMIWRCHIVYLDSRFHFFVTMLGCFMLVASIVTGSIWAIIVSHSVPSSVEWMTFSLLFPYLSVSLAITIFICTLIVVRLMYHRKRISKTFGAEYGVLYTGIATMVVESSAVYAISSLLYLIPYAAGSPLSNTFAQMLGEAQIIAPLLIVYRISEGKAWERDISRQLAISNPSALRELATTPPITSQPRLNRLSVQVSVSAPRNQHSGSEGLVNEASTEHPAPVILILRNTLE